jgi:uncharacterized protein (TIGR00369 family)
MCQSESRDIAPQRKTAYQALRPKGQHMSMVEQIPGMPEGAVEISVGGFNSFVGPLFRLPQMADEGVRRFAFIVADKHMNSAGSAHGGMLMAFMDVAMSRSARAAAGDAKSCSTVSLNCDFVGPGRLGDLIEARIRVTRRARTMVFLSGELVAGDRTLLVATGLWKVPDAS